MTIRSKVIATRHLALGIASTLSLATILGVGIYSATNIVSTNNANALSYSTNEDISFTFKPTLSISLSTNNLTIDNLVPGTTSDSNTVTVTVSSNTPYGYVLSAGVGSTVSTDPYYNTSDLVHDNSTTAVPATNKFSSIATSASLQTLDTDNTWGYSTSTDGGNNWSTYSGLSDTETKPLLDISASAQPSTIDFKIAARSSSTQASGTYNNVITFYAVGKPYMPKIEDLTYMQDFRDLVETDKQSILDSMGTNTQYVLKDSRDNKDYYISKMKDGKIWMTQNLDLELDSNRTYTPSDTNVSANWQPANSTIEFTGTRVRGWSKNNYTPYSASPGEVYYYTSGTTADDSQYTPLSACQAKHSDCSAHNHVGNYYNWSAAVASNDTNTTELTTQYNNAPDSICPAGWRLPTGVDSVNTAASREWNALLVAEGIMANNPGIGYATNGFNNIRISPLWLARSGKVDNGSLGSTGSYSYYQSSTVGGSSSAYSLYFYSGSVYPTTTGNRHYGYPIRCLVK